MLSQSYSDPLEDSAPMSTNTPSGLPYAGPAVPPYQIKPMTEDVQKKPTVQPGRDLQYSLTYSAKEQYDIADWVAELTGIYEDQLLNPEVRNQVIRCREMVDVPGMPGVKAPHLFIRHIKACTESDAGHMVLANISELAIAARNVAEGSSSSPKPPKLIFDMRKDDQSRDCVDISVLQTAMENRGSMFQVASNFNGVECISEGSSPDTPNFTTSYFYDHTQGPAASISAGAAAVARVHGAFYNKDADPSTWGQTATHQIEMLGDVKEYFNVVNGYVCNNESTTLLPKDPKDLIAIEDSVKVLVHANVDAMYGKYDYEHIDRCKSQMICQTFCAALNMAQGMSGWRNKNLPDTPAKAQLLLRAAYRGTFYAAEMYKCKKIYLTLIGGGVFGNNQEDIVKAILNAYAEISKINKFIEEIHVVFYRPPNFAPIKAILDKYPSISYSIYSYERRRPTVITPTRTPPPPLPVKEHRLKPEKK